MNDQTKMIAFGPVPSRRLGRSLGINNIPAKTCSYSCVYCQLGPTRNPVVERRPFYSLSAIYDAVAEKIDHAGSQGEAIDYLTFVSDGEPTLDSNLGGEIEKLNEFGIKVAVITNASLLWIEEVRSAVGKADWVSLKIDTVNESIWRSINRPHGSLRLTKILQGIKDFISSYTGVLTTETMLLRHFNDYRSEFRRTAVFLAGLMPKKSYISVPTRPPAEKSVQWATEYKINQCYQIFQSDNLDVEYLIGYEGNEFALTGDPEADLLGIMSVHPMREDALAEFVLKADRDWAMIEGLIRKGKLIELGYRDQKYFMRRLTH